MGKAVRKSGKSSEGHSLGSIVLESKSFDGLSRMVNFSCDLDLGVAGVGLGVLPDLLMVAGLVGQVQGEHSSERLLGLLAVSLHSESVGGLAGVVEAGHVVGGMAPRVALPLADERVISLGKSPDNTARLTHLLQKS